MRNGHDSSMALPPDIERALRSASNGFERTDPDDELQGERASVRRRPSPRARVRAGRSRSGRQSGSNAAVDFRKGVLRAAVYHSESESADLARRLEREDWRGAAQSIARSIRQALNRTELRDIGDHIRIKSELSETYGMTEAEAEDFLGDLASSLKSVAMDQLQKLLDRLLDTVIEQAETALRPYLREHVDDYIEAQRDSGDGVTIMATVRAPFLAQLRPLMEGSAGNVSLNNIISRLPRPSVSRPKFTIRPGFQRA